MEERTTVIVLRIIAIVTMVIGLILATQALVSGPALTDMGGDGAAGIARSSAIWGVVNALVVWGWGLALIVMSRKLARAIHA